MHLCRRSRGVTIERGCLPAVEFTVTEARGSPPKGPLMAAIQVTLYEAVADPDRATVAPRSGADVPDADEVRRRDHVHTVLLQLGLCGALISRDTIEFARGIAEIMIWSAGHARTAAEARLAVASRELAEWQCHGCGELVPGNFELCWQCERARE